jgi:S-DNA-T family DNA segregation ATPase FtsK/SpoIIIE
MATNNTPAKKPTEKKSAAKSPAKKPGTKKPAAKKPAAKKPQNTQNKKNSAPKTASVERGSEKSSLRLSLVSYGIGVCAILLLVLFIARAMGSDAWFVFVCDLLYGILSYGAWTVPLMMLYLAVFLPKGSGTPKKLLKPITALLLCTSLSVTVGLIKGIPESLHPAQVYEAGQALAGGGLVGGYISWVLVKAFSLAGAWVVNLAFLLAEAIFLVGLTLTDAGALLHRFFLWIWGLLKNAVIKAKNKKGEAAEEDYYDKEEDELPEGYDEDEEEDEEFVPPPTPKKGTKYYNKPVPEANPYADDEQAVPAEKESPILPSKKEVAPLPDPEVIPAPPKVVSAPEGWGSGHTESLPKIKPAGEALKGSVDLDDIFAQHKEDKEPSEILIDPLKEDEAIHIDLPPVQKPEKQIKKAVKEPTEAEKKDDLSARRSPLISTVSPGEEAKEEAKSYVFPPISLLSAFPPEHDEGAKEELATNARRLVDTLRSFKVRTKILDISRGPTITRYELQPEEGVRVRAIANLVDDISLSLASSGVRIEAPIPGKAAVGVEVPNKHRETVYLRTLLSDKRFESASAKLTAAIGVDVAGDPVFVDLAKMPHLLIAGTTGSGKSVCLNCLILSMLYKASPDEVKMIMIDPKKVEFNVYNGLPHLIIPVVSNNKKAAGALSWAVSEMERRYELIESVGVRDIKSYNKITKDDPEKEFMPQLVIIIDELADLMMTAPGEVEESICRIAQKGRASGMHLIIGTQRPSVDVITGLIKANVPSRVAFTVSSQVDSRTIIDIAGAEKLVGRGDMLFAPVGAMKPVRLQGAFVSDEEVEKVTEFIMNNSAEAVYDDQVMKDIEKEAALCGTKNKKTAGAEIFGSEEGDSGESDPMLKAAVDLAVESGKISTSLIQRRLSLGYGRAAKLIDQMQDMGIVGPQEGQKPRNVLISASEWAEMVMRQSDEA